MPEKVCFVPGPSIFLRGRETPLQRFEIAKAEPGWERGNYVPFGSLGGRPLGSREHRAVCGT